MVTQQAAGKALALLKEVHTLIWPVMEQGAKREPGHTVCTRQVKKGGISFVVVLANIHCT